MGGVLTLKKFIEAFGLLSRSNKVVFIFLTVSRVLANVLDVLGLMALGLLGSTLASRLQGSDSASLFGFDFPSKSDEAVLSLVLFVASFFILKSVVSVGLLKLTSRLLARVEVELVAEMSEKLFLADLNRLKSFSRGDIQFAITQSSHLATSRLLLSGSTIVSDGALFILIVGLFFIVDPQMAAAVASYFLSLVVVFQVLIGRRLKEIGVSLTNSGIATVERIHDLLSAFRELLVLSRRAIYLEKLVEARKSFAFDNAHSLYLSGLPRYFVDSALMLGVLALLGWQFLASDPVEGITLIAVFLGGGARMMAALLPLQGAISAIRSIAPQAELALEILGRFRRIPSDSTPKSEKGFSEEVGTPTSAKRGAKIALSNVHFWYPNSSKPTIEGISLSIRPGSHVALLGPSGAGKSTLVDLMLGVNFPTSGSILIDEYPPDRLREVDPGAVSYVPQTPGLVSGTIRENIALGVPPNEINDEMVDQVIRQCQLVNFVESLAEGPFADLGKHSDALSGGQRQRLGLARALYFQPRVLVMDEATSALDASTEHAITEIIKQLGSSVTVVTIAHRLSTVKDADYVFVIEQGKVSASGKFEQVIKRAATIEEYAKLLNLNSEEPTS